MSYCFKIDFESLPDSGSDRHKAFVDMFGEFLLWHRNRCFDAARRLVQDEDAREAVGRIRSEVYTKVANLGNSEREVAIEFSVEVVNGFIERLLYALGDEGFDARLGSEHAYRYRVELEVVDLSSGEVVEVDTINRGGRFFGANWGAWLNRFNSV